MLASQSLSVLRTLAQEPIDAASILERGNAVLFGPCEDQALFVTLFCGVYDPATRALSYANAGHPPPLLLRPGEAPVALDQPSSAPLGLSQRLTVSDIKLTLTVGDVLVLFTDGVTEARNATDELFGVRRLERCLETTQTLSPAEIVERIRAAVQEFTQPLEASDDLTVVVIRIT